MVMSLLVFFLSYSMVFNLFYVFYSMGSNLQRNFCENKMLIFFSFGKFSYFINTFLHYSFLFSISGTPIIQLWGLLDWSTNFLSFFLLPSNYLPLCPKFSIPQLHPLLFYQILHFCHLIFIFLVFLLLSFSKYYSCQNYHFVPVL